MDMFNTSGGMYLGIEGSAGGSLWTNIPAYATGLGGRNGGGGISFSANAITQHMLLTTSGLAVTGTLSATGLTLDSSGNLGLGVTPSAASVKTFEIGTIGNGIESRAAAITGLTQNAYINTSFKYAVTGRPSSAFELDTGAFYWYTAASGTAGNNISFTQAMTLDSSGNLLVGCTTKENRGVTIYGSGGNGIYAKSTGTTNYWITNDGLGTGAGTIATIYNDTTSAGQITVLSNATAYTSVSDYRLKNNVQLMTGALDKVLQLKPVTYTWKVDGVSGQGFIAHELQAIVPDCVVGEKDALEENGDIKPQSVDTSFLVATLTAAIQEQQAIITALTTRITALEAK
jgi:hypothetical protein